MKEQPDIETRIANRIAELLNKSKLVKWERAELEQLQAMIGAKPPRVVPPTEEWPF